MISGKQREKVRNGQRLKKRMKTKVHRELGTQEVAGEEDQTVKGHQKQEEAECNWRKHTCCLTMDGSSSKFLITAFLVTAKTLLLYPLLIHAVWEIHGFFPHWNTGNVVICEWITKIWEISLCNLSGIFIFLSMLGMGPKAVCMVGKLSITELYLCYIFLTSYNLLAYFFYVPSGCQ